MANEILSDGSKAFLNHYDISCAINTSDINDSRLVADARTLCGNSKVASANNRDMTASFGGFGINGTDNWEDVSFARMVAMTDDVFGVIYGGGVGDPGREVIGRMDSRSAPYTIGEVNGLSGGIFGENIVRTICIAVDEVVSSTGTLTGYDWSQVGDGSGTRFAAGDTFAAILRVTAVDTLTTCTFVVEESNDSTNGVDGSWAAIAGVTSTFTAVGHEVDQVTVTAGPIAQGEWFRINTTTLTGTSFTLTATVGQVLGV